MEADQKVAGTARLTRDGESPIPKRRDPYSYLADQMAAGSRAAAAETRGRTNNKGAYVPPRFNPSRVAVALRVAFPTRVFKEEHGITIPPDPGPPKPLLLP